MIHTAITNVMVLKLLLCGRTVEHEVSNRSLELNPIDSVEASAGTVGAIDGLLTEVIAVEWFFTPSKYL